jgi:hypothetical protein
MSDVSFFPFLPIRQFPSNLDDHARKQSGHASPLVRKFLSEHLIKRGDSSGRFAALSTTVAVQNAIQRRAASAQQVFVIF